MSVDFCYAQARAQARHADRLSPAAWLLVESSDNLAQYLHTARGTSLAPRIEHFAANSSAHDIERSLRRDWRTMVENTACWAPTAWRESITWTALLADLPAIAELIDHGKVLPWMVDDPFLRDFTSPDPEIRRRAIMQSMNGLTDADTRRLDDWWADRWQMLWPAPRAAHAGLYELLGLIREHRSAMRDDALKSSDAAKQAKHLQHRVVRILRSRLREPVVIFCHLLLCALEMQRLRGGLVRRALFNQVFPEVAA